MNDSTSRQIIELTEANAAGLRRAWKITRLLIELNSDGSSVRELGYDDLGRVVHRWPDSANPATRSILDGSVFQSPNSPDLSAADFQSLWDKALDEEVFFAEHDPFGDRFGTSISWWGCVGALAALAAVVYAVVRWTS